MSLQKCREEWDELEKEFQQLQETHKVYKQKLEELNSLQNLCSSYINKHKRRLTEFKGNLHGAKHTSNQEEKELVQQIDSTIKERRNAFFDMEAYLPKKNGYWTPYPETRYPESSELQNGHLP